MANLSDTNNKNRQGKSSKCSNINQRKKSIACADSNKKKQNLKQEESVASLTVALEASIATLVIDAQENRDVAVFDVPGAFLQPEFPHNNNKLLLKMKGIFVDTMCDVKSEF